MTAQEIINKFYDLVDDDNTDSDRALELLNTACDTLQASRMWNFLRKEDSSKTFTGSTLSYALPSDFLYPIKAFRYNTANEAFNPMGIVPFGDRMRYHKRSGTLYVDIANEAVLLTQTPTAQGISGEKLYLVYQYQPAQLALDDEPVFNRAFHSILAYEMAKIFWYMDQQEKERSFNREMQAEYNSLTKAMEAWDARIEYGLAPTFHSIADSWVPAELM